MNDIVERMQEANWTCGCPVGERMCGDCFLRRGALAEIEHLEAENARYREALAPFADFAKRFDAMPLGGLHDDLYVIHAGTEWEASIRLSSLRACRRAMEQNED